MNITSETIFSVRDTSGNILFRFPDNNVLINIIPDLWPSIIKYFDNHLFAIGYFCVLRDDFRLVTKSEMENNKIINLFAYLYKCNNGILNLMNFLDNNYLRYPIYCDDDGDKSCLLSLNETYIHVSSQQDNKNDIITLCVRDAEIKSFHDNIEKIKITYGWRHASRVFGLFIRKDYHVKNEI